MIDSILSISCFRVTSSIQLKSFCNSLIKIGDILTVDNITTKRPYLKGNLAASEWFNTLGKKSNQNYNIDDFIK